MAFYADNAISWALHRLRGGWKNLLIIDGWYLVAALLFISLPYELAEQHREKMYVLDVASTMILILQVVMLLLLCGMSVAGAIRRDLTSRIVESHRLMPLSPVQAIVGYLAGGPLQILSLCFVNLILGSVICTARAVPVQTWLESNGLLFVFSVSVWTAMAMAAFVSRSIFGWLVGLLISVICSGGAVFVVLPGLLAFCSPMQGRTIFESTSMPLLSTGTIVALVAQLLVAILCIRGAARKYADGNALSLTMGPSLAALGIWAGLTWFGIADFHDLHPRLSIGEFDWRLPVIGGIASCLLLSLVPLAAMAWSDILRRQRRLDGHTLPSRPWLVVICMSVCLLFVLAPLSAGFNSISVLRPQSYSVQQLRALSAAAQSRAIRPIPSQTVYQRPPLYVAPPVLHAALRADMITAVCAIFLVEIYLIMRLLYPVVRRANALILVFIAFSWLAPLFADVIYYGIQNKDPVMNTFALYSPFGTMIQALDKPVSGTWRGVSVQAAGCLLFAILLFLVQSRRDRRHSSPIGLTADL
jgi:hypothetical protein